MSGVKIANLNLTKRKLTATRVQRENLAKSGCERKVNKFVCFTSRQETWEVEWKKQEERERMKNALKVPLKNIFH